jgi:hypothetical protein
MASVVYNEFKRANMAGEIDMNAHDIRAKLLMSNTTCDTENDGVADNADFTTIDASDATDYADVALTTETVTKIDASDRAKFSSDNVVFSGLGGDATRDYVGILLYKYVDGTDANDIPIAFIDFTADIDAAATQVTVPCPDDGWMYLS